jgi:hypothetical protein
VGDLKKFGVRIPEIDEPPGWPHHYICPSCAVRLTFDRNSEREHRCPLCKGAFHSVNLNKAWISELNYRQVHAAFSACILEALDGDGVAADLARQVLLGYARRYPDYPERRDFAWTQGRVEGTSLQEAVWMLPAVQVYGFLRDNGWLTDLEQTEVIDKMFVPAVQLLSEQQMLRRKTSRVHNIQVWHAAAILALAAAAGRAEDVASAEDIVTLSLREGVLPNGSWFEGSPHYHFYALEAFTEYALAARGAGRPLIMPERLRGMFASPVQLLLPDHTLPLFNDGWDAHPLASRAESYEVGQHLFGGFEGVLSTLYRESGAKRTSTFAFLYGPDDIPEVKLELKSLVTVDGVTVVRRKGMIGLIKATPFGGGHDHPDKPGLYLFHEECGLKAADIGNPGYGHPLRAEYYCRTVAHNTVMVDGKDQALAPAEIVLARERPEFTVVQARAHQAYPGVAIVRTVVFGDGWAFDWVTCRSTQEHAYVWLFHANGPLRLLSGGLPVQTISEAMVPNNHVTGQRRLKDPAFEVEGEWSERGAAKGRLFVQLWSRLSGARNGEDPGRFVGQAESPDLPATGKRGLLLAGGRARNLDVIACFCWGDAEGGPVVSGTLLSVAPGQLKVEIAAAGRCDEKPLTLTIASAGLVDLSADSRT